MPPERLVHWKKIAVRFFLIFPRKSDAAGFEPRTLAEVEKTQERKRKRIDALDRSTTTAHNKLKFTTLITKTQVDNQN